MVNDILEHQQQNMMILKRSAHETRTAASCSLKTAEDKCKYCRSWTSQSSCRRAENVLCEHDAAQKGKGKGHRSRSPNETILVRGSQKDWEKSFGKVDRLPCFNYKTGIVVMIESVIIGISRIANTSRNLNVKRKGIVRSSTYKKKESIYQSSTKRKRQRKRVR